MVLAYLSLLIAPARPVSFVNDVEPILARAGCNSGTCHGMQFGKGGFKLSLFGFDAQLDHEAIVKQAGGRRISVVSPADSLLLRKASLAVPHGGGLRVPRDSVDFRTIAAWIQQGAPPADPHDPHLTGIEPNSRHRILHAGASFMLRVTAAYSDGSRRDVTAHARITSLNETIAPTSPDGKVVARAPGATAVMIRYGDQATACSIDVPFISKAGGLSTARTPSGPTNLAKRVDSLVARRWREMGLSPSPVCTDSQFVRRVFIDVIGTLPAPEEIRAFLASKNPRKRERLVDDLLERPEYVDYWALRWSDLLRNSGAIGPKPMWALNTWIREQLRRNASFDSFVRELLTANGRASSVGPANYFRIAATPQELTESTAQLFLGIRMQCARCHNHPFERWTQADYYRFAAFFARVSVGGKDVIVAPASAGEVKHPRTGAVLAASPPVMEDCPTFLDSTDRREALANWLTSPRNMQFAKTVVNRYWGALLGRGIVNPVDDMRITNPPSNPDLLDYLTRDFIAGGFDIKRLIRQICSSRTYQLSSRPIPDNLLDDTFFTHHTTRRLPAEVMLDAVSQITGSPEKFAGFPVGVRAIQLPDASIASPFLDTFGRPPRSSVCECERASEPSLPQALQLLNGDSLQHKLTATNNRIDQLLALGKTNSEIVEELYLAALSRFPGESERRLAVQSIASNKDRRRGIEDILWALLNTNEFAFIQ